MNIRLLPLTRMNWVPFSALRLAPKQQAWVPDPLNCIAESAFEQSLRLGIVSGDTAVGLVVVINPSSGEPWISRIIVDQEWQHQGIGTTAMRIMLHSTLASHSVIRTSVHSENIAAKRFFERLGFRFAQMPGDPEEVGMLRR